ncbi:LOW QUALITY PROTEIN: translation initiation factor eIF2B subunit gamma-like [Amphiura filiformis]|uniref:LOW QUALITY PROTEIN: translation initiation factor eIF2B subunit gamma-like n=1 Tax=Amphiura filiformis TaxID=82378 RepID=UPI003B22629D
MEFQAVIMAAGRGSHMMDLTASMPKPLLPIGNRPMIWYPVNMLQNAGFERAMIVTFESVGRDMIQAIYAAGGIKIDLEIVTIPNDEDWGAADSLRHIRDKIKTDVLVVSCDLVTNVELHLLADVHRAYDATATILLQSLKDQSAEGVPVPGTKSKRKSDQRDIIGLDDKGQRLLLLTAEADIDEALSIRTSLLRQHPYIQIKTNLKDAHMYILKKWVVDFLAENEAAKEHSTVKGELIPYLVKKQFSRPSGKGDKNEDQMDSIDPIQNNKQKDIDSYYSVNELTKTATEMSSWSEYGDSMSSASDNHIRCHTHIMQEGFCMRANTTAAYCEVNRQIVQQKLLYDDEPLTHPSASIKPKTTIGQDSMVGEGTTIGEKDSVKRSIIGKHCSIGDKVKIANSVVMDHVTIKDGCTIQGSILCGNTHINEGVELKDCIVGSSQNVPEKSKFSNEVIGDSNRMMEI